MNRRRATLAGLVAVLCAACGSGMPKTRPSTTSPPAAVETKISMISTATRMVCADEVEEDLAEALGADTTAPLMPTWVDHLYSCRYVYANGSMRLSVKQLGDATATERYFDGLTTRLGTRETLRGLGERAFTTANHSVVVQKDEKVLVVDPTDLPARFGTPPDTPANVALTVAATIMGCWTGH